MTQPTVGGPPHNPKVRPGLRKTEDLELENKPESNRSPDWVPAHPGCQLDYPKLLGTPGGDFFFLTRLFEAGGLILHRYQNQLLDSSVD